MGLKIALTGGIGSGKSTAASYFAKFGVPIIDADLIARDLTQPGTVSYKKIIAKFGKKYLDAAGFLNRKKIAHLIFTNRQAKIWLEKLLHPKIRNLMQQQAKNSNAPYSLLVAPLFFTTKFPPKVDKILLVTTKPQKQIQRVCKRDQSKVNEVKAIIKAQAESKSNYQIADNIINNCGSLFDLKKAVKKMHVYYLSLV